MRVFLTGASGFVGSYVLAELLKSGRHEVAVLLRSPKAAWRIGHLLERVHVIEGDLTTAAELTTLLEGFAPEAFVHIAWGGVSGAERNDLSQWRNVPSALELVESAHRLQARHWIGLGSQAEYGPCSSRIDESTPTAPTTLYGVSKLAACNLSARVCNELGMRHAWLRLFSSYGPKDHPAWLIPYLVQTLVDRGKPSLTPGEQLWDYIFVEDVASAVAAVLESPDASGVFNLGSGRAVALRRIVERIRDLIDPELPLGFGELPYRPDQVMHLEANVDRLKRLTGWQPQVDVESGLVKTVNWYVEQSHERRH